MKHLKNEDKEENPLPTLAQDELSFSSAIKEDEREKLPSSSLLPPQAHYLPRKHGLDQMESQHLFQKMKARA
jgi:hypothetical protein